MKVWKATEI